MRIVRLSEAAEMVINLVAVTLFISAVGVWAVILMGN